MLTARIAFACRSARTTLFTFANEQFRVRRPTSRFFYLLVSQNHPPQPEPPPKLRGQDPSHAARKRLRKRAEAAAGQASTPDRSADDRFQRPLSSKSSTDLTLTSREKSRLPWHQRTASALVVPFTCDHEWLSALFFLTQQTRKEIP